MKDTIARIPPAPMTAERAKESLKLWLHDDNTLFPDSVATIDEIVWPFPGETPARANVHLDGDFDLETIRALVWWMENALVHDEA